VGDVIAADVDALGIPNGASDSKKKEEPPTV
jgi:hypothetical protein